MLLDWSLGCSLRISAVTFCYLIDLTFKKISFSFCQFLPYSCVILETWSPFCRQLRSSLASRWQSGSWEEQTHWPLARSVAVWARASAASQALIPAWVEPLRCIECSDFIKQSSLLNWTFSQKLMMWHDVALCQNNQSWQHDLIPTPNWFAQINISHHFTRARDARRLAFVLATFIGPTLPRSMSNCIGTPHSKVWP